MNFTGSVSDACPGGSPGNSKIWYGQLYPLLPMRLTGVVWYQGGWRLGLAEEGGSGNFGYSFQGSGNYMGLALTITCFYFSVSLALPILYVQFPTFYFQPIIQY